MKHVQTYGTADDTLQHAGTHKVREINTRTATRLERKWRTWRNSYCKTHPGDYPLRHAKNCDSLWIGEIGKLETGKTFSV
jgi:hypothetical protein